MNQTLTKIIEDWIGEDVKYHPTEYHTIAMSGMNKTLSDLRARVPELVESITLKFTDILAGSLGANVMGLHHDKTIQDVLRDIINSLASE